MASVLLFTGCAEAPKAPPAKAEELPVFPPPPEAARFYWERTIYGSADVLPDSKEASLRRAITGEGRVGEGMSKPYGVAARNGRIYVGDTVSRVVFMYDLNNKKFTRIGADDPGALRMPFGLDFDDQDNLYVVDGTLKRVHVYDRDGKFLRFLGEGIKWSRPAGLAIDSARKRAYVVDVGGVGSNDHMVRVLDTETGKLLFDIGTRGDGPGQFNLPRDAVVGPDGTLYVVDGGNFRIQVFDTDGKFVKTFGSIGRQTGNFARPKEIAADREGNIYVVDTAFGNFQIFNPKGELLLNVGGRGNTDAPARFMLPSGIAVDTDGRVYLVDQYFKKVDVFRPAGVPATARYGVGAQATAAAPAGTPPTNAATAPRQAGEAPARVR
jgi:DNA-binding beta-propeller fold protein YncE